MRTRVDGDQGLAIANEITRLHREFHGRGAANARCLLGRSEVVVFLQDVYTTVERTLIDAGEFDTVRSGRLAFQAAMRDKFCAAVEGITGRRVTAFMSQVHQDPDVSVELFVLDGEVVRADDPQ
jgi:uncharacterized protein YbcI